MYNLIIVCYALTVLRLSSKYSLFVYSHFCFPNYEVIVESYEIDEVVSEKKTQSDNWSLANNYHTGTVPIGK